MKPDVALKAGMLLCRAAAPLWLFAAICTAQAEEVSDAYDARLMMATCVQGSARPEERIRACSEIIKGNMPAAAELALVFLNRASAYKAMGDQKHADMDYAEALRRYDNLVNPDQPVAQVIYQHAVVLQALGQVDRALALLNEAVRLEPLNAVPLIERAYIVAHYNGDLANAIMDFDKALALAPDNVEALLGRGDALGRTGDFARSLADLDRAIVLAPGDTRAHVMRGLANARRNDAQSAATDYDAALRLDPRNTDALVNRAALYSLAGQQDKAIADLDAAIAIRPNDPLAFFNRGYAHFARRQFDLAIDDYSAAISLDPRMGVAYNNRCATRVLAGRDVPQALVDCNKALELAPDSIDVRNTRGLVYLKIGQPALARVEYDGALKHDPRNALALYGRGLARIRTGDAMGGDADRKAAAGLDHDIEFQFRSYGLQ